MRNPQFVLLFYRNKCNFKMIRKYGKLLLLISIDFDKVPDQHENAVAGYSQGNALGLLVP